MAVFRVEKTKDFTVMSNHHLRNTELSLKAKGLLSLMLSLPEDWDYTTKGLAHICRDGVDSITTALKELERHGYLTRQRLRNENGQLGDIEYTIHEKPVTGVKQGVSPKRENPRQVNPRQAKPEQAEPEQENPAQLNTNPQKTKKSKTDISRTHQSIYPEEPETAGCQDGIDRMDMAEAYRGIIKENIEYDFLVPRYGQERMDETVELMLETVLSRRPYIRIAGDDFPREVVRSRFLKINSDHLEYVFDCIDKNVTKVNNIKAYLLAALYNAPATMDSYASDYLAGHADCAVALVMDKSGETEVLKAYPQGEERRAINAVFDEIVADLKLQHTLTHAETTLPLAVQAVPLAENEQITIFTMERPSVIGQLAAARSAEKSTPAQAAPKKSHAPEI